MDASRCPECGQPLERADDFWYCDNPACPSRRDGRRPVKEEIADDSPASEPAHEPPPDGGSSEA